MKNQAQGESRKNYIGGATIEYISVDPTWLYKTVSGFFSCTLVDNFLWAVLIFLSDSTRYRPITVAARTLLMLPTVLNLLDFIFVPVLDGTCQKEQIKRVRAGRSIANPGRWAFTSTISCCVFETLFLNYAGESYIREFKKVYREKEKIDEVLTKI